MPKTKFQSVVFTAIMAFRFIDPKASQPILVTLGIQCMTCCQMVPVMTLFATLLHGGLTADWFTQWLQLAVICFPMALCAQVFFIGPLVRFIFRTLFKKQLAQL